MSPSFRNERQVIGDLKMEPTNRDRTSRETKFVQLMLEISTRVSDHSKKRGYERTEQAMMDFIIMIIHVNEVLWGFRRRDDVAGVADALGLTVPGLEYRCEQFNLEPTHFQQRMAFLPKLSLMSKFIRKRIEFALKYYCKQWAVREDPAKLMEILDKRAGLKKE